LHWNLNKNLTFDFLSPKLSRKDKGFKPKHVWAIAGGKGGTGKTVVTTNLGVQIAQKGSKVLLIDGDLGGANLHTCLGMNNPKKSLGDFLSRKSDNLEDILSETRMDNLFLINGSKDMLDVANLKYTQKMRFIKQFKKLDMDFILIDLGAGTNFNILDFFISADVGILVLMPEPTSIENAYRFLKATFYRKLRSAVSMPLIRKIVDDVISNKKKGDIKAPIDLLRKIQEIDQSTYEEVCKVIDEFKIKIVINQIRATGDLEIGEAMSKACKRYFGIETEFLGCVHYDEKVWKSIQARVPLAVSEPNSRTSKEINKLIGKLLEA